MDNKRACASLLVLFGVVLLALAGPVAGGGMKATFAGGAAMRDAAVLRRLMTSSSMLEDSVVPELTVDLELHRRVLADFIKPEVYNPNRQACLGPCQGRGKRYRRGCEDVYQCPN